MKKKHIAVLMVILLLVVGWTFRYVTMNTYYDSLTTNSKEIYMIGDVVPFEDDMGEMWVNLNGYTVKVERFEILNTEAYIQSLNLEANEYLSLGEKVALVYITLSNENSDAEGVMLTDFSLRGIDNIVNMDWDLLAASNPVLQGNFGISLSPGTDYNLILPYTLQEEYFSTWTWNHIENYNMYLRMTISPTEKVIQVQ